MSDDDYYVMNFNVVDRLIAEGQTEEHIANVIALAILCVDRVPRDVARELAADPDGDTARAYKGLYDAARLAVQATRRRN